MLTFFFTKYYKYSAEETGTKVSLKLEFLPFFLLVNILFFIFEIFPILAENEIDMDIWKLWFFPLKIILRLSLKNAIFLKKNLEKSENILEIKLSLYKIFRIFVDILKNFCRLGQITIDYLQIFCRIFWRKSSDFFLVGK